MKFICMYADYLDLFQELTDVRRGRLIMAILEYAFSGKETELKGDERMAFITIRNQLDRDRQKYDETCQRNRANGRRGGRPRKNPTAATENPAVLEKPIERENESDNINDKDNDKDNHKDNDIISEKESGICPGQGDTGLPPQEKPTRSDVCLYCKEHDLIYVNPMKFYDYYEANGWRMGDHAMADWTAALRSWDHRDREAAYKAAPEWEDHTYTDFKRRFGID